MKDTRRNTYRIVNDLDQDALRVSEYADKRGCNTSYLYELIRNNKADFEIVVFKGINFVINYQK
jgi:hypothetical protein